MSRAWAVSLVTLREGLRGWTLPGLWAVFAASLLASGSGEAPVEDRLRGLLSASGTSGRALLILAAVLLGALALRREHASRILLQQMARPLGRGTYFLGKLAGLVLLLGLLAGAFAATASLAAAALSGAGDLRILLVPLPGDAGRFERTREPSRIRALLYASESPGRIEAEISGDGGGPLRVALVVNARSEAEAVLPPALPEGGLRVRLVPDFPSAEVRLFSDSAAYPGLLARAFLADWALAAFLCAAALAASTVLSAPVALFLALGLTVTCHGHGLLGDLEAILSQRAARAGAPPPAATGVLRGLRLLTPDASADGMGEALDRCESPPDGALGRAVSGLLPYGAAAVILGLAGMRRLEPGA